MEKEMNEMLKSMTNFIESLSKKIEEKTGKSIEELSKMSQAELEPYFGKLNTLLVKGEDVKEEVKEDAKEEDYCEYKSECEKVTAEKPKSEVNIQKFSTGIRFKAKGSQASILYILTEALTNFIVNTIEGQADQQEMAELIFKHILSEIKGGK